MGGADAPGGVSIAEMRGRTAFAVDVMPGLTELQRRVARLMLRNTSRAVFAATGELVVWVSVATLTEIIVYSLAATSAASVARAIKRARARLVDVGLLEIVERGGGRGGNAKYLFRRDTMAAVEGAAHQAGVAQAWGGGNGDRADGDVAQKGDSAATVKGDTVVTFMVGENGDKPRRSVDLPQKGDTVVTVKGGGAAAGPGQTAKSVDKPVDKSCVTPSGGAQRVTNGAEKGDKTAPKTVTPQPPEHIYKLNKKHPRAGARGDDRRQRELRLLTPIAGNSPEKPPARNLSAAASAVEGVAKVKREKAADQRHQDLLDRAATYFSAQPGMAGMAVSAVDPAAIDRIRAGWRPNDAEFAGLMHDALGRLQDAGLVAGQRPQPVAARAEPVNISDIVVDIRLLQQQVTELVRLVATLLSVGQHVSPEQSASRGRHAARA
jgi:hypothetical protein